MTEFSIPSLYVTQLKTPETDGYFALQIAAITRSPKNVQKTALGITKKAGIKDPLNFFREIRVAAADKPEIVEGSLKFSDKQFKVGDKLLVSEQFKEGDKVQVEAVSKGKGFQGVVKRHGFAGGPKTHGQSDRQRAPGSIGSTTTPGRVFKGMKMAGRMGGEKNTVRGLQVVAVTENKLILKGTVPGPSGAMVIISKIK